MPKSLADGHRKFSVLFTKPEDPEAPTPTELNGGIDASCNILASDFTWSAADSDKIAEKALCAANNANSLGPSNFTAGVTVFREFDETDGTVDATADALFQGMKEKGTEFWGYHRKTGKDYSEAWAEGDEIALGLHVITDTPQEPSDSGGYIKQRIPLEPQFGWPFGEVAADGA